MTKEINLNETNQFEMSPEVEAHIRYLEQKLDPVLLDEFKMTKRRNHEWEGNLEDKSLFKI